MLLDPYVVLSLSFTLLAGVSWMISMTKFELSFACPLTIVGVLVLITAFSVLFFWRKYEFTKNIWNNAYNIRNDNFGQKCVMLIMKKMCNTA